MQRGKNDAEQTRMAILDAAVREFSERGITGTTLERISRAAGVTRGAFYWHFKDKIDLLRALVEQSAYPQQDMMAAAAAAGHDDPFGLLESAAHEVLTLFEADERRQRLFRIMTACNPGSEEAEWFRQADIDMFRLVSQITAHARQQGTLTDEFTPDEAAGIMMITMKGLLSEWLRTNKAFSLGEFGKKVIRKDLQFLRKRPED